MKYIFLTIITAFLVSCNFLKKDNAVKYNNSIIDVQTKILDKMTALATSFSTYDSTIMFQNLEALNTTLDSAITVIDKMEGFDGSTELKEASLNLFKFYKKTSQNEYPELLNILKKEDMITDEDKTRIDEINNKISAEETPLDAAMKTAQTNLSEKYKFKLEKTKGE